MKETASRYWISQLGIACALPVLGVCTANAQEATPVLQLEKVTVTATKTGPSELQRTPVAVSVVGSDAIEKLGINNIKDLAPYVPNVTFSQNTASAVIYIRGIGSNNLGPGSDPDVTMQLDGVYVARPAGQLADFLDVDRIEVLRGPQGTLYGRNAVGGTINVISRQPSSIFSSQVRQSFGNFGGIQSDAYVTGPVTESMQASIAVNYRRQDAFFQNIAPNGPNLGNENRWGGRVQLRWTPNEIVEATTRADVTRVSNENFESYDHLSAKLPFNAPLANGLVGNLRQVAVNSPQNINKTISGLSEDVDVYLSDTLTFKSLTGWRQTKFNFINDNDASELNVAQLSSNDTDRQLSQEFNLKYVARGLKAVAGFYYITETDSLIQMGLTPPSIVTVPPAAGLITATPRVKSTAEAIFAQATYEVAPRVSLTGGARYTSEKKTMDQFFTRTSQNPATFGVTSPGFPITFKTSLKDNGFTPKIGVDFKATDDALLYVSATQGFKSGGFNFAARSAAAAAYAPEKVWSYEAGLKSEWLDHRLRLNLTAFYYDYTNLQVQQLLGVGNVVVGNAASATVKGVELEFMAKATRELQLSGNLSTLDAKYKSYPAAAIPGGFSAFTPNQNCVAGACTIDASNKYLTGSPKLSGVAAADYKTWWDAYAYSAHLDYAWRSRTYFDPSNIPQSAQDAYGLFNASVSIGSPIEGKWRVDLYGKNLADKKYFLVVAGNGFTAGGIVGDPRMYGVRLTVKW